jgi:hypothetical protein
MLEIKNVTDDQGQPAIGLVLAPQAVFMDGETPRPGVALMPGGARQLAYHLLLLAQQIENSKS